MPSSFWRTVEPIWSAPGKVIVCQDRGQTGGAARQRRSTHSDAPDLAEGADLREGGGWSVERAETTDKERAGRTKVKKLSACAVLLVGRLARMGNWGAAYRMPMPTETTIWKPIQSRLGELT